MSVSNENDFSICWVLHILSTYHVLCDLSCARYTPLEWLVNGQSPISIAFLVEIDVLC